MGLTSIDDKAALAVHADELDERGDARADLIRAHLAGLSGEELITEHWSAWLGTLSTKDALLRWQSGHVIDAGLNQVPEQWQVRELVEGPAFRFLSRLSLGPSVRSSLAGLEALTSLRELVCFSSSMAPLDGLAGRQLENLHTLTIDAHTGIPASLSSLRLPRLVELNTRCAAASEELLFRTIARANWWPSISRWTHRIRSVEGLMALRVCEPLVAREGRGLVVLCEEAAVQKVPAALKKALPHAEFSVLPTPTPPRDPDDSHSPAAVAVTPVRGSMHFRSLPPWTVSSSPGTPGYNENLSSNGGSGIPFSQLNWSEGKFVLCGWCGSADTRCIHENGSSMYSRFETTWFSHWEYECMQCGLFTSTGNVHVT